MDGQKNVHMVTPQLHTSADLLLKRRRSSIFLAYATVFLRFINYVQ